LPELPDVTVYVEALRRRVVGSSLLAVRLGNPFVLRSVSPRPAELAGLDVVGVERLGKRIVTRLEGDFAVVLHLMVAGRLHWFDSAAGVERPAVKARNRIAALDFSNGTLVLTEAGTKKRASLHLVSAASAGGLDEHDRGGMEVLDASLERFRERLLSENHTLKRALTDPRLLSGIGNSYSDEILHRARLSPLQWTSRLDDDAIARLFRATQDVLEEWTARLREEAGEGFPKKVTAFREGMAVHGRYRQPCPACGGEVQRIVYASNESNYCPACQTEGRLLKDRALSQLLRGDWPKTVAELEERRRS
jgi:formamidopyrimidine-DNA glycosylase